MTVANTSARIQYNGNGVTTQFSVPFEFLNSASNIEVIFTDTDGSDTTWVEGTQYDTIDTNGDSVIDTVEVNTSPTDYTPASGTKITIKLNMAFTQPTDFASGGAISSSSIETALDKSRSLDKQLQEQLNRSALLKESTTTSGPLTMPEPAALKVLRFNSAGTDLEAVPLAEIDVFSGPASSTDNAVPRFDGTAGDALQDSGVLIDDSDNITVPGDITVTGAAVASNLRLSPQSYGAIGDWIDHRDGAITSSTTTLTSAKAAFVAADVGKIITVKGAGAAGVNLNTTIASINSGTSVELADAASTTVSSAVYWYGTQDESAAFASWLAALSDDGNVTATGYVPPGQYAVSAAVVVGIPRINLRWEGTLLPYQDYDDYLMMVGTLADDTPPSPGGAADPDVPNLGFSAVLDFAATPTCDGLWQARGIWFYRLYDCAVYSPRVFRPHGIGMKFTACWESGIVDPLVFYGLRRLKNTGTINDWDSGTAYVVGDWVRFPHSAWAGGLVYAVNDYVDHGGNKYRSLVAPNAGNDPATSPAAWERVQQEYYECLINNTNKDPQTYSTHAGNPVNHYWGFRRLDEPAIDLDEDFDTNLRSPNNALSFYNPAVRTSDYLCYMRLDTNRNITNVNNINIHGGLLHNISSSELTAMQAVDSRFADNATMACIEVGAVFQVNISGPTLRVAQADHAKGLLLGNSNANHDSPKQVSGYGMLCSGSGASTGRQVGISVQKSCDSSTHQFTAAWFDMLSSDSDDIIDPNGVLYADSPVPLRYSGAAYLNNIVEDTTPQLGANLDANGFNLIIDHNRGIIDDSANEQLVFIKTASAANYMTVTNAAASGDPKLAAAGSDTDVGLLLASKGSEFIRADDTVVPNSDDGAALGTGSLKWSDLFLANGAVLNFNNGDVTLTHSANTLTLDGGNIAMAGAQTVDGRDLSADGSKLDGIESGADVTDATNVDAAGAVMESDYDAQTVLAATTDNTPAPVTLGEQTVLGRLTGGNVAAVSLGISDNNLVQVDGAPNAAEYARWTANGLEGRTEAEFKADFNLEIGTDVQAYDAELAALAGLTSAANKLPYFTGSGTAALAGLTAFGRSLIDDADARRAMQTLSGGYLLAASFVAVPHTGDTAETTLATVTIPANSMGAKGFVRVRAVYSFTGSTNVKAPRIRFGGTGGTLYVNYSISTASFVSFATDIIIGNRNNTSSQVGAGGPNTAFGFGTAAPITSSVDTTSDVDLVLRGVLANAGETITLEYYTVELFYAA